MPKAGTWNGASNSSKPKGLRLIITFIVGNSQSEVVGLSVTAGNTYGLTESWFSGANVKVTNGAFDFKGAPPLFSAKDSLELIGTFSSATKVSGTYKATAGGAKYTGTWSATLG